MISKLLKMHDRYLELHLSSSRGSVAKSIKIYFFPLLLAILFIISILAALITFTILYFQSFDEIIYSKDVDRYIKDRLGSSNQEITFINPIKNENAIISQEVKKGHHGIDIATSQSDNVYASATGQVIYSGYDSIYGNVIILSHQDNFYTFYGHLDTILVESHNFVKLGDVVGLVGESGIAKGPHLHFEIWSEDGFENPLEMGLSIQNIK